MNVRGVRTFAEEVGLLRRTLHRALAKKLANESDRPLLQLFALRFIANGEVCTQADLAERLLIDPPAASRLVSKLEGDGLLRRRQGSDRRCVKLEITARGKPHVEVYEEGLSWLEREVKKHATAKELELVMRTIRSLQDAL